MSLVGQSRRFDGVRVTSALPSNSDIARCIRHVSKVPNSDIARMKRSKEKAARWRLFNSNLTQLAQNRHPSLNKSTSWSKSWHYIFGKVAREKAFLNTNLSCRRESRGLVGVNCGGWHYITKSVLRAT